MILEERSTVPISIPSLGYAESASSNQSLKLDYEITHLPSNGYEMAIATARASCNTSKREIIFTTVLFTTTLTPLKSILANTFGSRLINKPW